jgi:ribonuclease Z
MKILFLGTGGAVTSPTRTNTSILIEHESSLLIDCSGSPYNAILRAGGDPDQISHILLTHSHTDHIYALPSFIHQAYLGHLKRPRKALTVLGLSETLDAARQLLSPFTLLERSGMFEINFATLPEDNYESNLGILTLCTYPVNHVVMPTLGVQVKSGEQNICVYSCDTEPMDQIIERSKNAYLLIHECNSIFDTYQKGHTTLDQLRELLQKVDTAQIKLVHLPPMTFSEESSVVDNLRNLFDGKVSLAHDYEAILLSVI